MMYRDALQKAIEAAGGQEILAKHLGVPQSLISYWLNKAKRGVPAERVPAIEDITGIPRHELRPDIYPAPTVEAAE